MIAPPALSTDDLGWFFSDAHGALAARLVGMAEHLSAVDSGANVAERARAVAAAMGRAPCELYPALLPPTAPGAGLEPAAVDVRQLCLIRELLGYVSPLADAIFAVQGLGTYPLILAGSADQRASLDAYRQGTRIAGFALTEPEAGSDVASMQTTAHREGDFYVLRGQKTLISNVGIASQFCVFANANPQAGRKGITAFWVAADNPGLRAESVELGVDHPIGDLHFHDCRVAKSALIGQVGDGFRLAMQTLDTFRVTVGAAAVGMARRALCESIAHVTGRSQFGAPLATRQIVQSYLADMATELDAARLLVLRAAYVKDTTGKRVSSEAAKAKLFATEAAQRIIDRAVQLHGGIGVKRGTVVENLYRAIRPLRIYEGTSEIQRLIIGRSLIEKVGTL